MRTSLWRCLARPAYLFSAAPWAALLALIIPPVTLLLCAGIGMLLPVVLVLVGETAAPPVVTVIFGLLILVSPLLLLALAPAGAVWYGHVQRWLLRMLGFRGVSNAHVPLPVRPLKRWFSVRYREPATWREVLASVIDAVAAVLFTLLLGAEAFVLGVCAFCAGYLGIYRAPLEDMTGAPWRLRIVDGELTGSSASYTPEDWWRFAAAGLVALLIFGYLNGLVAAAWASLTKALMAPRPEEIQRQVDRLTFSRAAIMESFEAERRRIERDLHDGVQQELVNLSLRLGMVQMELGALNAEGARTGPAQRQLAQAQEQTTHALQTLRNTVRGIYPAVLEDHGLRAALEELANNALLPTELTWAACAKLPPDVERTAYYAVSEAMTNALKHSAATRLRITAHTAQGALTVQVHDDGQGGADAARGSGISGLDERAQALGGSVTVDSPVGGPTVLRLWLPLDAERPGHSLPWGAPRVSRI